MTPGRGFGSENDIPPSAAAREHARGRIDAAPPEEYPHAGLVRDDTLRRLLDSLMTYYDPHMAAEMVADDGETPVPEEMPPTADETRLYRHILRRQATGTLSTAVRNGDETTISYFTGAPDTRSDISGLSAISTLESEMLADAPIIYIFGSPGSGKTNFALLLAELWKKHREEGEIGTNIRTWDEADEWIPRWGALESWIDTQLVSIEGGVTQAEGAAPRLFVFDEASSHAAGHGEQGYETREKLAPLVYKIRKARAGLIIIGHDGKDVHPAIRTMATCVERRQGELKRAVLWEDVIDRQGRHKIVELAGIPETSYNYDDKEATAWSWTGGEQEEREKEEEIRELAKELSKKEMRRLAAALATDEVLDLNQSDIGRIIGESYRGEPYDQSWVAKWTRKYREDEL